MSFAICKGRNDVTAMQNIFQIHKPKRNHFCAWEGSRLSPIWNFSIQKTLDQQAQTIVPTENRSCKLHSLAFQAQYRLCLHDMLLGCVHTKKDEDWKMQANHLYGLQEA